MNETLATVPRLKAGRRVPILLAGAMLDDARSDGVAFVLDIAGRTRARAKIELGRAEVGHPASGPALAGTVATAAGGEVRLQ